MVVDTAESAFDAERALLAAICAQGDVVFEVADLVAPSDFAGAGLGMIYEVLRAGQEVNFWPAAGSGVVFGRVRLRAAYVSA